MAKKAKKSVATQVVKAAKSMAKKAKKAVKPVMPKKKTKKARSPSADDTDLICKITGRRLKQEQYSRRPAQGRTAFSMAEFPLPREDCECVSSCRTPL